MYETALEWWCGYDGTTADPSNLSWVLAVATMFCFLRFFFVIPSTTWTFPARRDVAGRPGVTDYSRLHSPANLDRYMPYMCIVRWVTHPLRKPIVIEEGMVQVPSRKRRKESRRLHPSNVC